MDDLASQNYDFNEIKKLLEKNNYKPVSCISDYKFCDLNGL